MKRFTFAALLLFLLAGCAPREARYIDEEFGQAQMAAWDQQIINPNGSGDAPPEGHEGITAEEIMKVYNDTFAEKVKKSTITDIGKKSGSK